MESADGFVSNRRPRTPERESHEAQDADVFASNRRPCHVDVSLQRTDARPPGHEHRPEITPADFELATSDRNQPLLIPDPSVY